jgi:signal transduction histidine kinase
MLEIVDNILDNAVKYLSPDRPGLIEISGQRNGREALFLFCDNGRGIAKDDLAKIFGLFRRVGEQDTPGKGMGLAYVKALVRRQGGRTWCESEGAGTTFSVSIPDDAASGA